MGILASPERSSRAAKEVFKSLFQLVRLDLITLSIRSLVLRSWKSQIYKRQIPNMYIGSHES